MTAALLLLLLSGAPGDLGPVLATSTQWHNDAGKTALHLAAEFNPNPEVVRLLVNQGWELEARDGQGRTPLMLAARRNTSAVVETLRTLGANPRAHDLDGRTAADFASNNRLLVGLATPRALAEELYR